MESFTSIYNFDPTHVFLLNQYDLITLRSIAERLDPKNSYKFATRVELNFVIHDKIFERFPNLDESQVSYDWDQKPYDPSSSKWNHFTLERFTILLSVGQEIHSGLRPRGLIGKKMGIRSDRFVTKKMD